jgi:hypothetical protein
MEQDRRDSEATGRARDGGIGPEHAGKAPHASKAAPLESYCTLHSLTVAHNPSGLSD